MGSSAQKEILGEDQKESGMNNYEFKEMLAKAE
jgi:hypothetical protein